MPDSLFFKLVRVVNLTARPFRQRVGHAHELKLNEWRTMAVLGRHPGSTATQVAQQTGLDKMSVSRALSGLKAAGRLRAQDDPSDQRCSQLYLTAAGKTLHALVDVGAREREAELLASLTQAECEQLAATLDKLIAAVSSADPAH